MHISEEKSLQLDAYELRKKEKTSAMCRGFPTSFTNQTELFDPIKRFGRDNQTGLDLHDLRSMRDPVSFYYPPVVEPHSASQGEFCPGERRGQP